MKEIKEDINRWRNIPCSRISAGVQPWWIQGIRRVDGVGVERLVYLLI